VSLNGKILLLSSRHETKIVRWIHCTRNYNYLVRYFCSSTIQKFLFDNMREGKESNWLQFENAYIDRVNWFNADDKFNAEIHQNGCLWSWKCNFYFRIFQKFNFSEWFQKVYTCHIPFCYYGDKFHFIAFYFLRFFLSKSEYIIRFIFLSTFFYIFHAQNVCRLATRKRVPSWQRIAERSIHSAD